MKRLLAVGAALTLGLGFMSIGSASADHANTEVFVGGNPKCGGVKIEAGNIVVGRTYGPVTINSYDGNVFSFTSTEGVGEVIVKGGPNALVYHFNPAVTSGTGLHAPVNPANGKYYGISHVEFCAFDKK